MTKPVVIVGAGAVGKYVNYILSLHEEVEVVGFLDGDPGKRGQLVDGRPVLGGDEAIADLYTKGVRHAIIGVGTPELRCQLRQTVTAAGLQLDRAIHPSA